MGCRRFTRLTNVAAVALYVAYYNLCRVHEALKTTQQLRSAWGQWLDLKSRLAGSGQQPRR
jgi:hypothetical protein